MWLAILALSLGVSFCMTAKLTSTRLPKSLTFGFRRAFPAMPGGDDAHKKARHMKYRASLIGARYEKAFVESVWLIAY